MARAAQHKSRVVVFAALSGNLAVAAVKFAASLYTGSSAMLSESVHSLVDTGNQALLLLGMRQAARRPTSGHPFGHGLLLYFWSFIVAIMVFGLGAGVSAIEGVDRVLHPVPLSHAWVNYAVLAAGAVIEGGTLLVGLREFRRSKGRRGWFEALRHSKDPSIFTVVLEDSAALLGLLAAFTGLVLTQVLHAPVCDGLASLVVSALLASAAWLLARECHGLLTGEAAAPEVCESVRRLATGAGVRRVNDLLSMHFGPSEVLLALSLEFNPGLTAGDVHDAVTQIERAIQEVHPEMTRIFIEAQRTREHRAAMETVSIEDGQAQAVAPG